MTSKIFKDTTLKKSSNLKELFTFIKTPVLFFLIFLLGHNILLANATSANSDTPTDKVLENSTKTSRAEEINLLKERIKKLEELERKEKQDKQVDTGDLENIDPDNSSEIKTTGTITKNTKNTKSTKKKTYKNVVEKIKDEDVEKKIDNYYKDSLKKDPSELLDDTEDTKPADDANAEKLYYYLPPEVKVTDEERARVIGAARKKMKEREINEKLATGKITEEELKAQEEAEKAKEDAKTAEKKKIADEELKKQYEQYKKDQKIKEIEKTLGITEEEKKRMADIEKMPEEMQNIMKKQYELDSKYLNKTKSK